MHLTNISLMEEELVISNNTMVDWSNYMKEFSCKTSINIYKTVSLFFGKTKVYYHFNFAIIRKLVKFIYIYLAGMKKFVDDSKLALLTDYITATLFLFFSCHNVFNRC